MLFRSTKIELPSRTGEDNAEKTTRENQKFDTAFLGPHAISQAMLFNDNPTGKMTAGPRLDALTAEGGIQICGNAQNCVAVCPKEIPLTTSIARAGRATTFHVLKNFFDR